MKIKQARRLVAAVLLLVMTGIVPAVYGQDSLLVNPGFEPPFETVEGVVPGQIAQGWSVWSVSVNGSLQPEYYPASDTTSGMGTPRILSGEDAQQYFSFFSSHVGGVYQQVSGITPGAEVTFSINAWLWSSSGEDANTSADNADMTIEVGIDPSGGEDGASEAIVWSEPVSSYDGWVQLAVTATAEADAITVFVRSTVNQILMNNVVYLDDASLTVGDAPAVSEPSEEPTPEVVVVVEATAEAEAEATTEAPAEATAEVVVIAVEPTVEPPTATPIPTDVPTAEPPTATPIPTDMPTAEPPTTTPIPTDVPTVEPPTATPIPTDVPTAEPAAATPVVVIIEPTATPIVPTVIVIEPTIVAPTADAAAAIAVTPTAGATIRYVVQYGDSLSSIAARYRVSLRDLARLNRIVNPNLIFAGTVLLIPTGALPTPTPTATRPAPTRVPPTATPTMPPATGTYRVQPGDNLYAISIRFNVRISDLVRLNRIVDANRIFVGQILQIP
jgi:LysM repeat protein